MSELNIEVLLESWLVWDENYPLLKKNDEIKIAVLASELSITSANKKELFIKNIDPATYEFSGKCIYVYHNEKDSLEFVVIDTGLLKFYFYHPTYEKFTVGEFYNGKVSLMVDYFMWKESYQELPDSPDIIYNFKIKSIIKTLIPDKHIIEGDDMSIQPTTLPSDERKKALSCEVEKMELGEDMLEFFILNLNTKIKK